MDSQCGNPVFMENLEGLSCYIVGIIKFLECCNRGFFPWYF